MELLRTIKATRIVVLSDCREESSIVSLLNSGAHHHFYIDESSTVLKNRIDAALRIHNTKTAQFLSIDDIQFDTHKRLVCRSGKRIDLSPKEYELAYYLFTNLDRTIGNGELMSAVWSLPSHMDSRRIDTAACRVRKKLGLSPCLGWELKRIRMVGYRLLRLQTIKRMQLV
jgi:DNA-binding response OmpR family regulator